MRRVFGGLLVCFLVAGLLGSGRLVTMADRQEFGPARDRWLALAHGIDRVSSFFSLDRPADAVESALGRSSSSSTVVLGALAVLDPDVEPLSPTVPPSASPTAVAPSTETTEPTTTASSTTATSDPTTNTAASPTTQAPTTTTTAPPTTLAPTTTLPVFGQVSPAAPLRVWLGGDSLGEYVGSRIQHREADLGLTRIELDYRISTGLTRPDYFDWPARLSEVMQAEERPQVLVFMVGGNDTQDMQTEGSYLNRNTDEWYAEYRTRVATIMDVVAYPDTQLVWINLPPMKSSLHQEIAGRINSILGEEAARRPWVSVSDIVPLMSAPNGGFTEFLDEPSGDRTIRARAADGVHITADGSRWIAEAVWAYVEASWQFIDGPLAEGNAS